MDTNQQQSETQKTTGKKILIVDDDSFLLDMYAMRFTQGGFDVYTAASAEETITKLKGGLVPDIMLIDVVMPGKDGFELLEQINAEKLVPATIKIYLSNLGQEEDINRGRSLGAASYIVKANSTPSEVVAHVVEVLKQHGI